MSEHSSTETDSEPEATSSTASSPESADASSAHKSTPLSASSVFSVLSDERRRYVLYSLSEHDGELSFDALPEEIQAWESGSPDRDQIAIELYHLQLPKLADLGFIEYDDPAGSVRFGARADELDIGSVQQLDSA